MKEPPELLQTSMLNAMPMPKSLLVQVLVRGWKSFLREVVDALFLEVFMGRLDGAMRTWSSGRRPCPGRGPEATGCLKSLPKQPIL